jgi:hypothetical protein
MGVHLEDAAVTAAMDGAWFRQTVRVERADSNISEDAEADVIVFEDPSGTMCVAQQDGAGEPQVAPAARSLGLVDPAASVPDETPTAHPQEEPAEAEPSPAIGDGGADESSVLVPYLVGPFDTFSAICMRYHMVPEELQRVNGLRRRHARPGSTVLVWAQRSAGAVQEEMQRTLLLAFKRRCKVTLGEARYYLETSAYNVSLESATSSPTWPQSVLSQNPVFTPPTVTALPRPSTKCATISRRVPTICVFGCGAKNKTPLFQWI